MFAKARELANVDAIGEKMKMEKILEFKTENEQIKTFIAKILLSTWTSIVIDLSSACVLPHSVTR
jgi:hypothetical protein